MEKYIRDEYSVGRTLLSDVPLNWTIALTQDRMCLEEKSRRRTRVSDPHSGLLCDLCGSSRQTDRIPDPKRHYRPYRDIPSPRHRGEEPDIQLSRKPEQHPQHRPRLIRPLRQHSEQKDSEQCTVSHGRDLQPHFDDASDFV